MDWQFNKLSAGQHIYFSKGEKCHLITKEGSVFVEKLSSNQEEADTKIALHIKHATLKNPGPVVVRSHSRDTDIPVLLIALFADTDQTIYLDNGHGNHRKVLDLESCKMTIPMKKALLGLHAFTGNDYVSAFFKRGKKTCWSILQKYPQFLDVFMELGTDREPNEHINCPAWRICLHVVWTKESPMCKHSKKSDILGQV